MIFNRFLIPNVTRTFKYTSYGVSLILASFSMLDMFGDYITLTAFEIISFLIAFMWLIVLFDFLNHIIHPQAMTIEIDIERASDA